MCPYLFANTFLSRVGRLVPLVVVPVLASECVRNHGLQGTGEGVLEVAAPVFVEVRVFHLAAEVRGAPPRSARVELAKVDVEGDIGS